MKTDFNKAVFTKIKQGHVRLVGRLGCTRQRSTSYQEMTGRWGIMWAGIYSDKLIETDDLCWWHAV